MYNKIYCFGETDLNMKKIDAKTEKDLKKLSRVELLQMLVHQTKEVEKLREQLEITENKLKEKEIMLNEAGNIAEAALKINKVIDAAQAAADQYLQNIALLEERYKAKLEEATQEKSEVADL